MRVQLFSDLHIEFEEFEIWCHDADVVVFAGDIHTGMKGIEWIKKQNIQCPAIYVLGNHEYYRSSYPRLANKIKAAAQGHDIHVLENNAITLHGVRFHGATLWTDYELFGNARLTGAKCQEVMNDFRLIRRDPSYSRLRTIDAAVIHRNSLHWLSQSLSDSQEKVNVVVSHHAPSKRSIPSKYQNDIISAAYASNLEKFIDVYKPNYWLHGHIHNSLDYKIESCRVICNPKGYTGGEQNPDFNPKKLIEI